MKLNHFSDAIIVFGEAISMAKKHIKDEKKLVFLLKVGQLDLFEKRVFQLPSLVIDCTEEVH